MIAEQDLNTAFGTRRDSIATYVDAQHHLVVAGPRVLRPDYAPDGTYQGALTEGPATNMLPNASLTGGSGPDGIPPAGMAWEGDTPPVMHGPSEIDGFPRMDFQISGASAARSIRLRLADPVAAAPGDVWCLSAWGGTLGAAMIRLSVLLVCGTATAAAAFPDVIGNGRPVRAAATLTVPPGGDAVTAYMLIEADAGAQGGVLIFAAPQLEKNRVTSFIPSDSQPAHRTPDRLFYVPDADTGAGRAPAANPLVFGRDHGLIAWEHMLAQFAASDGLQTLVRALYPACNTLDTALQAMLNGRVLDVATGAQLDGIGVILGQPRSIGAGGITLLEDEPYRRLLRLKILLNNAHGTAQDVREALCVLFDADSALVQDTGDASLTAVVGRFVGAEDLAFARALAVLPKPAGVRLTQMQYDAAYPFGFQQQGYMGFGAGRMARSLDDPIPGL